MSYQISFVSGASLEAKISSLERRDLEEDVPLLPDISHQLSKFQFIRIVGLSRFWETNNKAPNESFSLQGCMEDVLTGLHGLSLSYAYIIAGEKRQLYFFKGVSQKSDGDVSALKTALTGSFPAIELQEPVDVAALDTILTNLPYRALMTGIPTSKQITQEKETVREQIERLLRGLYGERWAYLVLAEPLDISFTTAAFDAIAAEIKQTYNTYLLKGTVDESNRPAQHYIVLLESALEQFQLGKSQGMWNVATYLFTSNPNTLGRGMALLRAVYAGESSLPEPIRVRPCHSFSSSTGHSQSQVTKGARTNLNSKDLATLILLPKEEMPGFSLKDYARFDVSLPENKKAKSLAIGNVLLDGRSTGNWYEIECDDLAKHGLIVGVTGSGKTNTCFYLLHQLWREHHIPFLVIEPAKSEYRDMMDVQGFEELRVFTLGDETVAPFRMNPFEVMPGVHVQSHIDYLKSLFFASFVLYAPMPYVLEQSLHEVYEDKGWNLALNENPRGTGSLSYPTLTDLYYKIEDVVERLGYEERITMDVQAGLRARINSLRIGGKGLMLDVRRSIPMQQLLEKPTVLELKQIGDDEEKAFLIGLYLMRLYEYYESQFKLGKQTQEHGLRHLTIIEEAHRLLKNVPTEKVSEESSNIKGKAVEAFSNILSEIRAYGEGILIAEQIPVKLAVDAIKNTNLKVMHRLVSQEDREVMGGTMNLDEAQKRYVASISCGTAAVYAEGMDSPLLVQAPNYKGNTLKRRLSDDIVRQQMQQRFLKHFPGLFVRFAECSQCQRHTGCVHHNIVKKMLEDSECREHFSRFLLTIVEDNDMMFRSYADFLRTVRRHATTKTQAEEREIAFCALLHIMERALENKGQLYGWRYNEVVNLSKTLADIFPKISSGFQAIDPAQIQAQTQGFVAQFASDYRQLCQRERGHLVGCAFCQKVCLYQYEVAHLVKDKLLARDFEMAAKDSPDDNAMWISLANVCQNAAQRAVCTNKTEVSRAVALCFAAQKGAALKYSYAEQTKLVKNVLAVIDSQKRKE